MRIKDHKRKLGSNICMILALSVFLWITILPIPLLAEDAYEAAGYWVEEYDWGWPPVLDLDYTEEDTQEFLDYLENSGGYLINIKGDESPVAQIDFTYNSRADSHDIFWFDGHGGAGHILLANLEKVEYDEVSWGDYDLEWIMLHACETLADDDTGTKSTGKFAQALNGARLICGSVTSLISHPTDSYYVAGYMIDDDGGGADVAYTVLLSWFLGLDIHYDDGTVLRVIGEDNYCSLDYLWGQGGPYGNTQIDSSFSYWTYTCD
ncbi:MAG: DUF6345 domain-containing protein [Dehalococcoidales bacterium]|nr:DUF6345 domain-containing protein [Dehalococcoidales bacterium]MDD4793855.1 DUF6345 domain-containing protein [Dehalococcoidales bacterium]MDD5498226.1 DUF6345 domain-containing protein [Dehalococcoidales bacterium]MDX9803261.1 DUF6345 domain-containing protein [Dehalococcoidales bacterium]